MRFLCRIGVHKWSQWRIFKQVPIYYKKTYYVGSVYKMMRYCEGCNMVQFREKRDFGIS